MRFRRYTAILFSKRYLLYTNCAIGCLGLGVADFIQQNIERSLSENNEWKYDKRRTLSMMTGGVYFGICGHFWYGFLEKRFAGKTHAMVAKKLVAEALFGPFYVAVPFVFIRMLEGAKFEEAAERLRSNFYIICCTEWLFFLPLQAFNFYLLPLRFRVAYVALVSLIYDTFLSFIVHKETKSDTDIRDKLEMLDRIMVREI